MQHIPNLIQVAITAGGGRSEVAKKLDVNKWTVGAWQRTSRVPANMIRKLCALGNNTVQPEQLLAYIEQADEAAKTGTEA